METRDGDGVPVAVLRFWDTAKRQTGLCHEFSCLLGSLGLGTSRNRTSTSHLSRTGVSTELRTGKAQVVASHLSNGTWRLGGDLCPGRDETRCAHLGLQGWPWRAPGLRAVLGLRAPHFRTWLCEVWAVAAPRTTLGYRPHRPAPVFFFRQLLPATELRRNMRSMAAECRQAQKMAVVARFLGTYMRLAIPNLAPS